MSDARCHPDLQTLAESVEIHTPTLYALFGEPRDFAPPPAAAPAAQPAHEAAAVLTLDAHQVAAGLQTAAALGAVLTNEPAAEALPDTPVFMPTLETELYARLYVRPQASAAAASDPLEQRDHLSALSAANGGVGTWEPGWRVVSTDGDGRFAVTKDQVTFWVRPEGLRTRSGRARPGDFCRVWVGKEMRQLLPGFYFAFGNGDQQESRDHADPLVRFYWHLTREAAVEYMGLITSLFNRAGVPFRTKVLADPSSYVRADAGVLYLERRYFAAARPLVIRAHEALAAKLRPEVPMFAKRLADGLGLAEDPSGGMSFGQSRCRLAARGLWACFRRGLTDSDARLSSIAEAFRAEGLNAAAPHLERGSKDFYALTGELPLNTRPLALPDTRRPKRRRKPRARA
jgi:HopA1 effector protein family